MSAESTQVSTPSNEGSTHGTQAWSLLGQPTLQSPPAPPAEVGPHIPEHDTYHAPHAASPTTPQSPTTLIQKNTPPSQHAKADIPSETSTNNNTSSIHHLLSPEPSHSIAAEPSQDRPPSPVTPKSPSSEVQPQSSSIKVIKEPLQPEVELPEQFQDRSPNLQSPIEYTQDQAKNTLKNLNSKRQLPDSIPTELDSKKIRRNELLLNEANEKHAIKILCMYLPSL